MSAAGLFAQDLSPVISNNIETAQKDVTWLQLFLSTVSLAMNDLPIDDTNITFFESGYIGRSISRRRKCSAHKEPFVNGNEPCNIDDSILDENKHLFSQVGGGGLYTLTEFTYAVTALSVQFYITINADTAVKCMLFASSNRRADFSLATTNVLKAQDHANLVSKNVLQDTNFAFNCFAKMN